LYHKLSNAADQSNCTILVMSIDCQTTWIPVYTTKETEPSQ